METFNDGLCDIGFSNNTGNFVQRLVGVRYQDRVVGAKRFYMAAQAQSEINAVIRVQQNKSIMAREIVKATDLKTGITRTYSIEQVQHINDTNPPVTDLTLFQLEMFEVANE